MPRTMVGSATVARRRRLERDLLNQQLAELANDGCLLSELEQAAELERERALESDALVIRKVGLCLLRMTVDQSGCTLTLRISESRMHLSS